MAEVSQNAYLVSTFYYCLCLKRSDQSYISPNESFRRWSFIIRHTSLRHKDKGHSPTRGTFDIRVGIKPLIKQSFQPLSMATFEAHDSLAF